MPNWVYNGLTIEGNPESVTKLVNQMNQPFEREFDSFDMATGKQVVKKSLYPAPIFAFWNIVKPSDLDAYMKQPNFGKDADFSKFVQFEGEDWYNWNNRNWGTKWDVAVSDEKEDSNTYMEGPVANGDNLVVYYNFETAWSRPLPALENLSAQYPDLLLTLSYEEETGWGGECEFLRGKYIAGLEYETKCNECEAYDGMEYCEDCENDVCSTCGYGTSEEGCSIHPVEANV